MASPAPDLEVPRAVADALHQPSHGHGEEGAQVLLPLHQGEPQGIYYNFGVKLFKNFEMVSV